MIVTPVKLSLFEMLILSSIRASVAGVVPLASSLVKTDAVVPPFTDTSKDEVVANYEEEVFEEYDEFDEEKYNEYMDTYEDQYDK